MSRPGRAERVFHPGDRCPLCNRAMEAVLSGDYVTCTNLKKHYNSAWVYLPTKKGIPEHPMHGKEPRNERIVPVGRTTGEAGGGDSGRSSVAGIPDTPERKDSRCASGPTGGDIVDGRVVGGSNHPRHRGVGDDAVPTGEVVDEDAGERGGGSPGDDGGRPGAGVPVEAGGSVGDDAVVSEESRVARYLGMVTDRAIEAVASAGNGGRSTTLSSEAFRMGIIVGAGVMGPEEAETLLADAASEWDKSGDWNERRIRDHIARGLRAGAARGALRAVLPAFARDWDSARVRAAARELPYEAPAAGAVAAWRESAETGDAEEEGRRKRALAEAERMDLIHMAKWALHQHCAVPKGVQGREAEMLLRLSGPQLEMADLLMRGIDQETINLAWLGRALWPVMKSEKFPDRPLRMRRSIVIPWRDADGRVEAVQFRHVDDKDPKYHWLEGAGTLFGAEDLFGTAGKGLVVVEGALCALRVRSGPGMPHTVVGLPSESGWRKAYSKYGALIDKVERVWIIPDGVAKDSKSKAVWYADQFAEALGEKARVVRVEGDLDPDEYLNLGPSRMGTLLEKLDAAFAGV